MTRHLFVLTIAVISIAAKVYSQPSGNKAITILQKVNDKLNSSSKISYQYTHETRYYGDNYHYLRDASLYIEYTSDNPVGLRFQGSETGFQQVFNGFMFMNISLKNMTIDTTPVRSAAKLDNNSYMYNSLAMLRNILPEVIKNDSFRTSLSDTSLNGQQLYCVKIEKPSTYFGLFRGTSRVGVADLQRPYYLLVDKKTFLPYQFIAKYIRGNDDRDFVTVTYKNINLHPSSPGNASWQYAAYTAQYKPYVPAPKIPLVAAGTTVADFTLPSYTSAAITDISLHQYAGKVILLDFWFKSCGPCMQAIPHYNILQQKFNNDQFQLITVNVADSVDDIKFFYNKFSPVYPMLFNGQKLFESLGFTGCPSSALLDKNGKVVQTFAGFDAAVIEKKIAEVIAQK
ncbi:MAG: TlpA disulfide reductase family protein [Chitinophagaceae bacterium]